jgi:hypothetical protein
MNRRIFWWGVLMVACLESVFILSADSDCLGWAVPLLLALAGSVYWGGKWLYKYTAYRHHNFKLTFINRLPNGLGDPIIPEPSSLKVLPIQLSRLFIEVKASYGFPVKSLNFRCIAVRDIGADPVNSPVRVTNIIDHFNAGAIRSTNTDGYGGREIEYSDIRGLGKNRSLYFEIYLDADQEWVGTLSFKSRDQEGFCSYGRYAIETKPLWLPSHLNMPNGE